MRTARLLLCCLPLLACVTTRSAARDGQRGPVLFTVTHPSKPGASLSLMGTVHVERADFRFDRAVERAIDETGQLFVEIDTTPEVEHRLQAEVLRLGTMPEGQSAKDVVRSETWTAVERECTRLHLEVAKLGRLKPWLLGLTLSLLSMQQTNPGLRTDLGLDKRVLAMVRAAGKPITSLETADFQLALLSGGDAVEQDARLAGTLHGLTRPETAKTLFAAFEAGDLDTLERMVFETDDHSPAREAQMKRFWSDRNQAMFQKLDAAFGTPSHQLVAVGTGHLLGDLGLVRLFEQKGYRVARAHAEGPGAAWVAPWYLEKGDGFTLSFPGAPTRKAMPVGGAQSALTMWQGGALAYVIQVTRAAQLELASASDRQDVVEATVFQLAKGRKVVSSEVVDFLGHPAMHAVIEGGTPGVHLETYTLDANGVFFSLRAVSIANAPVPQGDFDRFFKSFQLAK